MRGARPCGNPWRSRSARRRGGAGGTSAGSTCRPGRSRPSPTPSAPSSASVDERMSHPAPVADVRGVEERDEETGLEMNVDSGGGGQLQDEFLQRARRDGKLVAIYLVGGVKLSGRVKGFDRFTVLLESKDQEQLIFKHAISTVTLV